MKKQAIINAINEYCERRNVEELTIDDIIEYMSISGTSLKWEMLQCVANIFAKNEQRGPRRVFTENNESIHVISENLDDDIATLRKNADSLIDSTYPDQNVIFEYRENGFLIIIESLIGL